MARSSETAFARTQDSQSEPGERGGRALGHTDVGTAFGPTGRYVARRLLGSGGMGSAWLAEDTLLLRPCVLKVLHGAAHHDASRVERFLREARSCVLRAVRGAVFPRFTRDSFTVNYPFRI